MKLRIPNRARKFLVLCGAILFLSLTSVSPSIAGPCSRDTEAPGIFVPDRGCFGLGIGYEYEHFNVLGTTFHNNAYNANLTMHLFDWLTGAEGRLTVGAEAATHAGFGGKTNTSPSLNAKSLFVGAGPHLAIPSRSRFEPWVHGLVGLERVSGPLGASSALGFIIGGGVDIRLSRGVFWRLEGNYVGTNFQSSIQSNYAAGTGLVLYF